MYLLRPIKTIYSNQKFLKTLSSSEVRSAFLDFFISNDHTFTPSTSVIPNDPSLLFVNSGMNQFKSVFLGLEPKGSEFSKLKRAVNSQKCIRAGGKHNDLEDVGRDLTHHTFFEMLGNWSFGDYSKIETCRFAWDFLTQTLQLPQDRLYFTYFAGDRSLGLLPDDDCRSIWENIGVPKDHILPFDRRSNFWEMAEYGPCGPCSEIHIDLEGISDAAKAVNLDGSPVVELWNLVFLQFNREECGNFKPLDKLFIDCGMGFERLAAVMQGVKSSYDTDIFENLLLEISKNCKVGKYRGRVGVDDKGLKDTSFRTVADHVRAACIIIADGVVPFEKDQGYVLRTLLRRSARVSRTHLGAERGIITEILPSFIAHLNTTFPEIGANEDKIKDIVKSEEELFWRTIDRGKVYFKQMTRDMNFGDEIPGSVAWNLHNTYGFNIDITCLLAGDMGLTVNTEEFEKCKSQSKISGSMVLKDIMKKSCNNLLKNNIELSDDSKKYDISRESNGQYVFPSVVGKVQALFMDDGISVNVLPKDRNGFIVFDSTNFYSEQGGQTSDIGILKNEFEEVCFVVDNVQRFKSYVFLFGRSLMDIHKGEIFSQHINEIRRFSLMRNHTATHLLGYALNEIFGKKIEKSGSLITEEEFHYDCVMNRKLTLQELEKIEYFMQKMINESWNLMTEEISPENVSMKLHDVESDDMRKGVHGKVRLVRIGMKSSPYAEFCCGTHLQNVGDLEAFALIADKSQRGGVRRLYGLTGSAARSAWNLAYDFEVQLERWNNDISATTLAEFGKAFFSSILPLAKKLKIKERFKKRKKEFLKTKGIVAADAHIS